MTRPESKQPGDLTAESPWFTHVYTADPPFFAAVHAGGGERFYLHTDNTDNQETPVSNPTINQPLSDAEVAELRELPEPPVDLSKVKIGPALGKLIYTLRTYLNPIPEFDAGLRFVDRRTARRFTVLEDEAAGVVWVRDDDDSVVRPVDVEVLTKDFADDYARVLPAIDDE